MKRLAAKTSAAAIVSATLWASLWAAPAMAQDQAAQAEDQQGGIPEIVVTAQKRAENVQDVPIAISAFTASALEERAVGDVANLSGITPNVTLGLVPRAPLAVPAAPKTLVRFRPATQWLWRKGS